MHTKITEFSEIAHKLKKVHAKCYRDERTMVLLTLAWTDCAQTQKNESMLLGTTSPGELWAVAQKEPHTAPSVQVFRGPRWVRLRG